MLAALCLAACDSVKHAELSIDVRTDARPPVDFDRIETAVFRGTEEGASPVRTAELDADAELVFTQGVRAAEFRGLARDTYALRVSLKKGDAVVLAETRTINLDRSTAFVFTFSRLCVGTACDEGQMCSNGICVDEGVDGGTCHDAADCASIFGASCTHSECVGGTCLCACDRDAGEACHDGEDCRNGLDDDNDGLVDCADPDCDRLACDDGNGCTTNDRCSGGVCGGLQKSCAKPLDACKTASCNVETGNCDIVNVPDGTECPSHPNRCCAGKCVDLTSDSANCGGCGLACKEPFTCLVSSGKPTCDCDNAATTNSDCPNGQVCSTVYFVCACKPGACSNGQDCVIREGPDYCEYR
ncbi:MAG: hypothetical protein R3A78_07500 [Polyangiales bacterium]|nr:hypothetical protein [Myxococcales bacterium]